MRHMISGIGCATSLGATRAETLAGYLRRAKGFRKVRSRVGVDGLPQVLAAALPPDEPRAPVERLAALLRLAFDDLARDIAPEGAGVPVVIVLPGWAHEAQPRGTAEAAALAAVPEGAGPAQVIWADERAATSVLAEECRALDAGGSGELILAVADTLCPSAIVDVLAARDAVLSRHQPHGLIPGEAAVALRVAPIDAPAAVSGWGHLWSHAKATEQVSPKGRETLIGAALAGLWPRALGPEGRPTRLLVDRNGERWRAEEAGHALTRNADRLTPDLRSAAEDPLSHLGDPGIARGALLVALALSPAPPNLPVPADAHWALVSESYVSGLKCAFVIACPAGKEEP